MLIIAGGSNDHNLLRLADAAANRGCELRMALHDDEGGPPRMSWNVRDGILHLDGEEIAPQGVSLYVRYDVYNPEALKSAQQAAIGCAWFDAIRGWALAFPDIGLLNRRNENREVSKPRGLKLAMESGMTVPETVVTNMCGEVPNPAGFIAKPVSGGSYTQEAAAVTDEAMPYFVQEKLDYPEMRIFGVGGHFYAFEIRSGTLDSRIDKDMKITPVDPPQHLVRQLKKLMTKLGLDYAAADFKTCPRGRGYIFLEINTMPILTGYDDMVEGRLSDALFLTLTGLAKGKRIRKKIAG